MFERVLITGANGHLGRRLISRLRGDCEVVAAVRSERAAGMLEGSGARVCIVDYGDSDALANAAAGCEAAVHLAGIIRETAANRYVDAHEGTARALGLAGGIRRIVYLSVVGAAPDSPNACLASKAAAESLLLSGQAVASVLRVPMVLGEGDYASLALGRRASGPLGFTFRAASFEQPVYAGDVVDAIAALLERADAPEFVELAGPERITRRELTRRAGRVLGRRTLLVSLPIAAGRVLAAVFEALSRNPPVTRAMLGVLDHDDDVDVAPACRNLGLELTGLDETLRRCLASPHSNP
ncbi:MAG: NAD(P)H-binding protein [Gammaproteobacteria bacterium]|nr:NAD(P)H-binding protein [Gammaproteobacteria bacterium]